ncbi:hypothetical protein CCMSSC00406_0008339 [Pleurotus cornucopiae]|uniref:Uncharacterized protein n=1 Tax=Pleurotus cornucopiae TaxID=5321 RepID=A0ACB7ITF5_PLECO|nr:hypothetical protein CCMSSC00406_0008339 [Pleurotus cornucopiae]
MPALYHDARISPRNDENTTRGTALASIIGISLSVVVVLGLLAVVYIAVTRFYRRKTKATRRAQEEGTLKGLVRAFDHSRSGQDRSTYPYHHVERGKHNTQQSGTAPLLGEDIQGLSGYESQDAARNSVVSTQEYNKEAFLPLSSSNETQPSTGPDRAFFNLPTPLSAGGSTFTFAGTREAMGALPPIDTTSPLTTAPLSAATASTAGPFSAFLGHAPLSATTTRSDSTFSALDRFPPPPVPALPAWYAGGDELKRRQEEEEEEEEEGQLGRTDTVVVGQMLKMRAKRAEACLSRGYTNISVIERSDSIKSVDSSLHSTSTKPARSERRLTSLKIPYFFAPSSIHTISPTSLKDVTPLADNPPSRTSVPTIGGPRPLRKGSKMPTLPMETVSEDPSSSKSTSSLTESSGLSSIPLLFSSTTVPGFTALMPRPESNWPVTPDTSSGQEEDSFTLQDNPNSLTPFNLPEASLTTAFRESIPLSAATLDTYGSGSISEWRDSHGSHPPPSFRLPAAAFSSVPVSGDSSKSTAPLRINPAKRGRSNNRSSSDIGHDTDAGDARSNKETRSRSRDSATSDSSSCPKLHIHTEVDPVAVTRSQTKLRSRPPSLERPAARVVGARMRGASTSSVSSDCSGAGHPVLGPKARVHDIEHVRQVPGMDAMLGKYHRVASMQGVVELGQ